MTHDSVPPISPPALTVTAFGITDKGKVRPTNEDQFLIAELTKACASGRRACRNRRCRLAASARICFSSPTAWADTGPATGQAPWPWSPSNNSRSIRSSGSLVQTAARRKECWRSSGLRSVKPMPASSRNQRTILN